MATKAQKIRLSIFLIISCTILLLFFVVLVGNRLLKRMDTYYIEYRDISVTGLEPGSAVKYHGVQVGRVVNLSVKDAATILVEIEVNRGTPIMEDTEAILTLIGITGLKFVELIGGSPDADRLPVRGTIVAGQSVFEAISGQAEVMLAKLEQLLNNLNKMINPETTESLHRTLKSLENISLQTDTLLTGRRDHLALALENLSSAAEKVNSTMERINEIAESDEIGDSVSNISTITKTLRTQIDSLRFTEVFEDFRTFIKNSNEMVIHSDLIVIQARDDILRSLTNLEEALENLREATDVIRENPSVLLRGRQTSGDRIE
ncbi:MlaD family protein [Candidatus Latescibacterota bacterium]